MVKIQLKVCPLTRHYQPVFMSTERQAFMLWFNVIIIMTSFFFSNTQKGVNMSRAMVYRVGVAFVFLQKDCEVLIALTVSAAAMSDTVLEKLLCSLCHSS